MKLFDRFNFFDSSNGSRSVLSLNFGLAATVDIFVGAGFVEWPPDLDDNFFVASASVVGGAVVFVFWPPPYTPFGNDFFRFLFVVVFVRIIFTTL